MTPQRSDPRPASRADPDALLAHVAAEDERRRRGRLKIFFGAVAGVGKTYAMLLAARAQARQRVDVVVGYVETHGRPETEALLEGLEILPRRAMEHRGIRLEEFDLEAALARRPALILVDELAHTNAPGSRHAKRWQDIDELLAAGIDVYTTVNVQHLESLNDVVAQITHVRVRETVPDSVLDSADEMELVDLPPDDLLKRLREGKVYVPQQAERAAEAFFRKGNLIALRQMALRRTADRVDAQMQLYRRAYGLADPWPVAGRLLVAVGPDPTSQRLIRATKRMADRLGTTWTAVAVETPGFASLSQAARDCLWEALRLAESLGGKAVTLSGQSASEEILRYARGQNISTIVVGKPTHPRWRDILVRPTVDELVRGSAGIDVYVITGDPEEFRPPRLGRARPGPAWWSYAAAAAAVALTTAISDLVRQDLEPTNLAMVYLLVVAIVAVRLGRGPSILASVLSVAVFDFFFVPPSLTFAVSDTQYVVTFAVMLVVALVISTLTARMRQQAEGSRQRERRTSALYEMSRELVSTGDIQTLLRRGLQHVGAVFESEAVLLLPDAFGELQIGAATSAGAPAEFGLEPQERAVARWVFDNGRPAGAGTATLAGASALYLPLPASRGIVGVLGVQAQDRQRFRDPEQLHLLETFANQIALAVERARLAEESRRIRELEEVERLKSEFVALASERLREPITRIEDGLHRLQGSAPAADRDGKSPLPELARELRRLRRLVDHLLDLAGLEAGRLQLRVERIGPRGLVERAVSAHADDARREGVELTAEAPASLPEVRGDPERLADALSKLVSSALHRTGPGGRVLVAAQEVAGAVQFSVADNGPGIPIELQSQIFERFTPVEPSEDGTGLELAIVREVVRAHGGLIWVDSSPFPGTIFSFTLPKAGPEDGPVVVAPEPAA